MQYLLNSAVITYPGTYRYELLTADAARALFSEGRWESTIGYAETAEAMSAVFGVPIAVDRKTIKMSAGDRAIVFRLVFPPGVRRVPPDAKGRVSVNFVLEHSEVGLLTRLE